jgi:hypothetical protein
MASIRNVNALGQLLNDSVEKGRREAGGHIPKRCPDLA